MTPTEPAERLDRHERRDEVVISAAFVVAAAAAVGLGAVYWQGGQPQAEGALLAVGAGGIAVGMITWAHRLLPQGPEVEDRPELAGDDAAERQLFDTDLGRGGVITRRRVILRSLGAAVVAFGAALLFPLRSLGPAPSEAELDGTPWRPGKRLVNQDATPVRIADVPLNGLVTVFPEGAVGSETGQAILVRIDNPSLNHPLPGREGWAPQGLLAYSKVCTHAGCPVGLYQAGTHQLLCPCHQSTFDVLNGAEPVFGPAAARLPQLPLAVDADGFVTVTGGFSNPPGPSFWNRKI